MPRWEAGAVTAALLLAASTGTPAEGPRRLALLDEPILVLRMADGSLTGWLVQGPDGAQAVCRRASTDNGQTWSAAETVCALPGGPGRWLGLEPLLDREGEVHLFLLRYGQEGTVGAGEGERVLVGELVDTRLDLWATRSHEGQSRWDKPRMLWKGYTGALNSVAQLDSGRILLPFSYLTSRTWANRGTGLDEWTFMGQFDCVNVYSDDGGESWALSASLRTPVPDIVSAYGAVEPVVIQLRDGRVWMLIRTQQGRLYESFSPDGAQWSAPQPTELLSSDSPVGIVRLGDGRLVLLWNNCLRFPYAYGGRHVLHAAISDDEGKTWRGFREVARDPRRNEPPPPNGDFGTAYPFPTATGDGQVIYCTGQGAGRVLLMRLCPDWLLERRQTADFFGRTEEWHHFGTRGVGFAQHPRRPRATVLSLCKTDPHWPAAVTWNFPSGRSGRLKIRLMPRPGCRPLLLGLTDHFSVPFDLEDHLNSLYNLRLGAGCVEVAEGQWHDVILAWDEHARRCEVTVDGRPAGPLHLRRETLGACYVRLRSLAEDVDTAGWLVEAVTVEVGP